MPYRDKNFKPYNGSKKVRARVVAGITRDLGNSTDIASIASMENHPSGAIIEGYTSDGELFAIAIKFGA